MRAYERLKDELAARDGQRIFRGWYERRFGVMALRVAGTLQQRRRLWAAGRLIVGHRDGTRRPGLMIPTHRQAVRR